MSLLLYSAPDAAPRPAERGQRSAAGLPRRIPTTSLTATQARPPARPELLRRVLDGLKRL